MSFKITRWPLFIQESPKEAKKEILSALTLSSWRLHLAAAALGMSRDQLRRNCKKLGIEGEFKRGESSHE